MPACPNCRQTVADDANFCSQCGSSLVDTPGSELTNQIRELMASNRKIEAIKVLREATGIGLAEAKRLIESVEPGASVAIPDSSDPDLIGADGELLGLFKSQGKIAAIKRHRELTGAGLRESKEFVEQLATRHGIVSQSSGCLTILLICISITVAIAMMFGGMGRW